MKPFSFFARACALRCRSFASISLLASLAVGPAFAADTELAPLFEQTARGSPQSAGGVRVLRPIGERPVVAAPTWPSAPYPGRDAGAYDIAMLERTVFNHVNLYRVWRGLRPLEKHSGLAGTARAHSVAMASGMASMSHTGMRDRLMPHMRAVGSRAGGEVLAYNRGAVDPARTAMRSWINSHRHKDVIEENYTHMGVGVARRADGAYYFTVLFVR